MKGFFAADGPFFHVLNIIIDAIYLTALFILTCIPIFTVGASMCALYHTAFKTIRHGQSYVGTEYFKAFKSNFKQATPVWLGFLVLYVVLGGETYILYRYAQEGMQWGRIYMVLLVIISLAMVWMVYVFAYMSRFDNKIKVILKNAAIFAAGDFMKSFILWGTIIVFMILTNVWFWTVFFLPSVYAVVGTWVIEKVFHKYMSEEQIQEELERFREYKN